MSLLLLDLDHFKFVNDTYGHPFGDTVLQAVASALPRGTRTYDLHARIGGEEFAILLPGADTDAGPRIAERVRHEVSRMGLTIRGATVQVTVSIGGVTFSGERADCGDSRAVAMSLLTSADRALYSAKEAGRDQVCWVGIPHLALAQAS